MHTLLFLDPGHFHAALTLRVPNPRVSDEIVVHAHKGQELSDFLTLVERFNRRPEHPTRWRPQVTTDDEPLGRLLDERRGDIVVLAGRNGGKARTMQRLHAAGFHVLADKPWLVEPEDLEHLRGCLAGWPLVMEIITGRYDATTRMCRTLVGAREVLGTFRESDPALEQESVHHLEKLVDGVPLRRPWWFFDVRMQGSGPVDIPTHLVDQVQGLVEAAGRPLETPRLLQARAGSTRVPAAAFCRITGESDFPAGLRPWIAGDALDYLCNAELAYRIGDVTARLATRWELPPSPGGADAHRTVAHGTRADIRLEQGRQSGHRRRLFVDVRDSDATVGRALSDVVSAAQAEFPDARVESVGPGRYEVTFPAALDGGHESHFPRVLDGFIRMIDEQQWPAALAERTWQKYTLLAAAVARTRADHEADTPSEERWR